MQKLAEIKVVGAGERARAMQQDLRREGQLRTGRFKRLESNRLLVGCIEQLRGLRAQLFGDFTAHQLRGVARLQLRFALLAFDRGERGLQCVFGCRLVAATALLVEIHRRAVQAHDERGRLDRYRRTAVVFAGHAVGTELVFGRDLPEEIEIEFCGFRFRQRQKFGKRRALELEQHVGRLDLGALAVGGFDLIGGVVFGHHVADLEAAVFFVKNVQVNHFRVAATPA